MTVLFAIDSFKGSCTSAEACAWAAEGFRRGWPGAETPMPEQYDALLLAVDSALTPYELRDVELRMGAEPPAPWPCTRISSASTSLPARWTRS